MNFIWDAIQQRQIQATHERADYAVDKTIGLESDAGTLQHRVEVMALANQALFEILRDRLGITEQEVIYRMAEIDASDGRKDGKMSANARVVTCRQCGRPVSTKRLRCIYCGEMVTEGHPFEKS